MPASAFRAAAHLDGVASHPARRIRRQERHNVGDVIRDELADFRRELRRAIECQQVGTGGVGKRKPEDPAYENAATLVRGLLPAATISIDQLTGPRCEADLRGAALCGWAAEGEAWEADLEGALPALLSDAV